MIFVSVGTMFESFDRLIKEVDRLAAKGTIKDVFAQIGYSKYKPQFIKHTRFLDYKDYLHKIKKSDLIITQGGVGTLKDCINNNKKTIVVPRLKKYKECINNHQIEAAKYLSINKKVLWLKEIKQLEQLIEDSKRFTPQKPIKNTKNIIETINKFINNF
jgi:UDP-N-acetylglucosamine transferase subunit ALG13